MRPRIDIVIPTRDRPHELARTLDRLDALTAESTIFVIDNASHAPLDVPARLPRGSRIELIRLDRNAGTAARNIAAHASNAEWLLVLDDDSSPRVPWQPIVNSDDPTVAAIGADIALPTGAREAGGLPEVFVGCGALLRRQAFLDAGGYDESFGYYAEETDLCARLIAGGHRIAFDANFRVEHRRAETNRSVAHIVERLARNETLVIHRYAPADQRDEWVERTLARRRQIAEREACAEAFERGRAAFELAARNEDRQPLSRTQWDRLIGRAFVRTAIESLRTLRVAVEMPAGAPGKHADVILYECERIGCQLVEIGEAEVIVAGTLAPGLALDAAERLRARHPSAAVVALSPLVQPSPCHG
ncbi:MAG: glycosyltransferase [Planctomycetota bacterium]